jgi:D-xylose transport system permease protein
MASIFRTLEVSPRLVGMLAALALIWVGFHIASGNPRMNGLWLAFQQGAFLTPRNLWNLSVQTASIGVMACGMVLVIVTRNIDLSVGSMLGFIGMIVGVAQVQYLPAILGPEHPATWMLAVLIAVSCGAIIGAFQGSLVAYLGIPSFIVTLGTLLIWRSAAWKVTSGQTIAPMDGRFKPIGGGIEGAIGASASWIVAAIACVLIILLLLRTRQRSAGFGFHLRPVWGEVLIAAALCGGVIGAVAVANAYPIPAGVARRLVEAGGGTWPEGGLVIPHGLAVPLLIAIAVGVAMTILARRMRFGRYVFAIGGNPDAAELSGVNTRRTIMLVFALMGALVGIAACISTARLNAATNSAGTLDELYVIAAAVIGGTSLAGGVGTIIGAMLGALIMQSLQSGMVLLGYDTPDQAIVIGAVLIFGAWLDVAFSKRGGK